MSRCKEFVDLQKILKLTRRPGRKIKILKLTLEKLKQILKDLAI